MNKLFSRIYQLCLISLCLGEPIRNRMGLTRNATTLKYKSSYGTVGSKQANIKTYPYKVSITYNPSHLLIGSGTMLNKNWIVCSAYEINDFKTKDLYVRVGSSNAARGGQNVKISKIIIHEQFQTDFPYDVALIKTARPIKLSTRARPIKLASTAVGAGAEANVTGFGETLLYIPDSGKLQVATVQVQIQSECKDQHLEAGDTCFCADSDNVGLCEDDLGSPLVKNGELIGWFLGGDYCNFFGGLEIYANSTAMRPWILDNIKQNSKAEELEGIDDDSFYNSFESDETKTS